MISQEHPSTNFDQQGKPTSVGSRILLASSLILGFLALTASGFLVAQVIPLNQRVGELAAQIQTNTSGSTEGIVALDKKITALDKGIQSQSAKLSKTDETIVKLNKELSQIKNTQTDLNKELSLLQTTQTEQKLLHIGTDEAQDIGYGFLVTNLKAYLASNGISLAGTIINTGYIQHTNTSFRITIAGQSKPLVISQLRPGESQRFEVDFPEVPIDKASHARIDYEGSTVSLVTGYSSQGSFYP
jgi:hypothetical protein